MSSFNRLFLPFFYARGNIYVIGRTSQLQQRVFLFDDPLSTQSLNRARYLALRHIPRSTLLPYRCRRYYRPTRSRLICSCESAKRRSYGIVTSLARRTNLIVLARLIRRDSRAYRSTLAVPRDEERNRAINIMRNNKWMENEGQPMGGERL